MTKYLAATLACSWMFLGPACGRGEDAAGGDGGWAAWETRVRSAFLTPVRPADGSLPQLGRLDDLEVLPEDRNLDFTFPDTLCGHLVQRLLECEIARIRDQPRMQENEKKSVISHKRRTFARKREQYLSHCQGKVAGLPEQAVRSCLPLPCVEMDRCLQKISGQTGTK